MTDTFRVRIERKLIQQATKVAEEIGTTAGDVVRLLFRQMVKRRTIPFPLQADTPESEVFSSPERRSKLWDQKEFRRVLIPIIERLPEDPEWDKVEATFAGSAYKKLKQSPPEE